MTEDNGCERCGACCVYFGVSEEYVPDEIVILGSMPRREFKQAGKPCKHLSFEDGLASCAIYDSPNRPEECQMFNCNYLSLRYDTKKVRAGLEATRRELQNQTTSQSV